MTRRAAIYLRISIDHTGEGLAVDRQRHDCEARAKDRDWEVVRTFEESVSAAGSKHREQFELLLEGLERGDYDTVIGWNLDRLTRNRSDTLRLIATGERKKTLISLIRGMELDMSTPMGRGFAGMLAEFAQMEIEIKGDRQRAAQKQRAELGRPPKGMRPLGYSVNGDVLNDEAKIVQKVYESFNAGTSVRAIALALSGDDRPDLPSLPALQKHSRTVAIERNAKRAADGLGLRPVPSDGPWSPSTVLGILRNPRYAGYSTYTPKETLKDGNRRRSWRAQIVRDDDGDPVRGQWIPIVLPDIWESVQDRLDDVARVTNKKGTDRKHLGSGSTCAVCAGRRSVDIRRDIAALGTSCAHASRSMPSSSRSSGVDWRFRIFATCCQARTMTDCRRSSRISAAIEPGSPEPNATTTTITKTSGSPPGCSTRSRPIARRRSPLSMRSASHCPAAQRSAQCLVLTTLARRLI